MKSLINKYGKALLVVPALVMGLSLAVPAVANAAPTPSPNPGSSTDCKDVDVKSGIGGGANCAKPSNSEDNLFTSGGIFQTVSNILLFLVGAISVIMLIIGGIRYVISGGDQGAVTSAKNTILYAIVGIVVAFLAFAAVSFVIGQLEGGGSAAAGIRNVV